MKSTDGTASQRASYEGQIFHYLKWSWGTSLLNLPYPTLVLKGKKGQFKQDNQLNNKHKSPGVEGTYFSWFCLFKCCRCSCMNHVKAPVKFLIFSGPATTTACRHSMPRNISMPFRKNENIIGSKWAEVCTGFRFDKKIMGKIKSRPKIP